jgi:acetyl-CoA synthetase
VSLTSGDVSGETKAIIDAAGGMPMLRGAVEAFSAIARLAWWEARRSERLDLGPWRAGWPALSGWPAVAAEPAPATGHVAWAADPGTDPLAHRAGSAAGARLTLPERESLERLGAAGVAVTRFAAVPLDADAAVEAWRTLGGGSIAIKLDAVGLAHKTETGAVSLGLADEASIREGVTALAQAAKRARPGADVTVRGLLVEPMAPPGVEIIVGGRRDAVFGPAVLVGLGGIFTEVLDDVAVLLAPVTPDAVRARLETLRGAPLLRGVRGRPGVDVDALGELVAAVARFLADNPDVLEVDLNPVIASREGALAVDALVISGGAS